MFKYYCCRLELKTHKNCNKITDYFIPLSNIYIYIYKVFKCQITYTFCHHLILSFFYLRSHISVILQKHRVLIPKDATQRAKKRQSMAFFVNADDDCVVRCLDGSDKYEPITVKDYLFQRILQSYY